MSKKIKSIAGISLSLWILLLWITFIGPGMCEDPIQKKQVISAETPIAAGEPIAVGEAPIVSAEDDKTPMEVEEILLVAEETGAVEPVEVLIEGGQIVQDQQNKIKEAQLKHLTYLGKTFKVEQGKLLKSINQKDFQEVINFEGDASKIEPDMFLNIYLENQPEGNIWMARDDEMDLWSSADSEKWNLLTYSGGEGSKEYPYQIANTRQLKNIGQNLSSHFILIENIVMKKGIHASLWEPLETFDGSIDGRGKYIDGVQISEAGTDFVGMFKVLNNAEIKELEFKNCNVEGKNYVGCLAGKMQGSTKLHNVKLESNQVKGNQLVGGLVGHMENGSIEHSYANGKTSGNRDVGGLVGWLRNGKIAYSHVVAEVSANSVSAGGLVGWMKNGKIEHSHAKVQIIGDARPTGGLVASMHAGSIQDSYVDGYVEGNAWLGGLVGEMQNGSIKHSHTKGFVKSKDGGENGGFVGKMVNGSIQNSHTSVTFEGDWIGGFVGRMLNGKIENSYATGNGTGVKGIGGFILNFVSGTISHCYATGDVNGKDRVSGFVAQISGGRIENSYFAGKVAGQSNLGGFTSYTYNQKSGNIINSYAKTLSGIDFALSGVALSQGSGYKTEAELQILIDSKSIGPK